MRWGIRWGIRLAPVPNGHPTFPRKSAFFFSVWGSVGESVEESVGESVGGSVWPRPKRTPQRIPQRKKNALFLGKVRFFSVAGSVGDPFGPGPLPGPAPGAKTDPKTHFQRTSKRTLNVSQLNPNGSKTRSPRQPQTDLKTQLKRIFRNYSISRVSRRQFFTRVL